MPCRCQYREKLQEAHLYYDPDKTIYMDYNATTPVDVNVIGAFEDACRFHWANPSSLHSCGLAVWEKLQEARKNIAEYFMADPDGLRFCSSGSEGLHALIWGILARKTKTTFITTDLEHPAILHPLRYAKKLGIKTRIIGVESDGKIRMEELESAMKKSRESLVCYSPVNHETGILQPAREIYSLANKYSTTIVMDGVQAANRLPPEEWTPYADGFCLSAHKIYAPKGTGVLWVKKGIRLRPFRMGGYQEDGFFPGTENFPGIMALSQSVNIFRKCHKEEITRITNLTREGEDMIRKNFPDTVFYSGKNSTPGILCLSFPWIPEMEKFMFELNRMRICVSRFSACNNKIDSPSRILLKMGVPLQQAKTSLRISLGRWSKREDFYYFCHSIKKIFKNTGK